VPKGKRSFAGFDQTIIALYARGLSVRDIQAHLAEIYGVDAGQDLISRVTDAVLEDVRAWQQRPLEEVYRRPRPSSTSRPCCGPGPVCLAIWDTSSRAQRARVSPRRPPL
jgi:hypothetical protein